MKITFTEKQIHIIEIAEKLFAANGFDGTSVREIAKEANVNIAMISYYFGSKEKLLETIIKFRTKDLGFQLDELSLEPIPADQKMKKLVKIYVHRMHANNELYKIINIEFYAKRKGDELSVTKDLKFLNLMLMDRVIKEGQKEGIFRPNVEPALIMPTILGTYFHFLINKSYFQEILKLPSHELFDNYVQNQLTAHIQDTVLNLLQISNN